MFLARKRLFRALLAAAATAVLSLFACRAWKTERILRVVDTEQNRPAANKTFVFFEDAPLAPLVKGPGPIRATLDANGQARVRLPNAAGWATLNYGETNSYGTSLRSADIANGGRFRLYGSPPVPGDTNLYPSKYVLEIKRP